MLAFLVMVRDALIAMALAWVGVTLEQNAEQSTNCGVGEACQTNDR
jgi:hypothetical protein